MWLILFRMLSRLGLLRMRRIGLRLGHLLLRWRMASPVEYARINLQEAWPELSDAEIDSLLRQNVEHLGRYLMECFYSWGAPHRVSEFCSEIKGLELILQPQRQGKAVLILLPHCACIELGGIAVADSLKDAVSLRPIGLYRILKPRSLYRQIEGNRFGFNVNTLPVQLSSTLAIRRQLLKKGIVFIGIDTPPKSVDTLVSSCMGIPTHTAIAPLRLAQLPDVHVVSCASVRTEEGFRVEIYPVNPDIASEDLQLAARAFNEAIESGFALAPEQAHWHLRRFAADPQIAERYAAVRLQKRRTPRIRGRQAQAPADTG